MINYFCLTSLKRKYFTNSLIYGLGVSGMGVVNAFARSNIQAFAIDDNNEKLQTLKTQSELSLINFSLPQKTDVIILSPGIDPQKNNKLIDFVRHGSKIVSDLDVAKAFNPHNCFIGITGTNGKSTTTTLVWHLLNQFGVKTNLCGNIGKSPLDFCDTNLQSKNNFCVEVSSYQASITNSIFDYATFLNITPDHGDRHGGFEGYFQTKCKFVFSAKKSIINADDAKIMSVISKYKSRNIILFSSKIILPTGISVVNDKIYNNGIEISDISSAHNLIGQHNKQNIAAAVATICAVLNFQLDFSKLSTAIACFKPLEHRIEFTKEINGVKYYNDSKATNVQSCEVAIKCFKNIILLVGGLAKDEGIDYFFDKPDFFASVKRVICYGQCGSDFFNKLQQDARTNGKIKSTLQKSLKDALEDAKNSASNGDTVLLSPCCASFDEFKNFEHRGQEFKKIVNSF